MPLALEQVLVLRAGLDEGPKLSVVGRDPELGELGSDLGEGLDREVAAGNPRLQPLHRAAVAMGWSVGVEVVGASDGAERERAVSLVGGDHDVARIHFEAESVEDARRVPDGLLPVLSAFVAQQVLERLAVGADGRQVGHLIPADRDEPTLNELLAEHVVVDAPHRFHVALLCLLVPACHPKQTGLCSPRPNVSG